MSIAEPTMQETQRGLLKLNRNIRKEMPPEGLPPIPAGWGYVGKGVDHQPIFADHQCRAIRFVDRSKPDPGHSGDDVHGQWSGGNYQGVITYAHYAVAHGVWEKIEWK